MVFFLVCNLDLCSFLMISSFSLFFLFCLLFSYHLLCIIIEYTLCILIACTIFMQRNYRFFFMFVFSTTLLCIYVFAFCWVYIVRIMASEETTIWKAMIKTPASIVLIIYTFISMWFVGGLTAFHLYLISTNQVSPVRFNPHALAFQMYTASYLLHYSCRLHMKTSDTDMIGEPIHIIKEC